MNLRQKPKERNLDERISNSKMRTESNFVDAAMYRRLCYILPNAIMQFEIPYT
jgi:hypothetical protein